MSEKTKTETEIGTVDMRKIKIIVRHAVSVTARRYRSRVHRHTIPYDINLFRVVTTAGRIFRP